MPGEASGDARLAKITPGRNARFAGKLLMVIFKVENGDQWTPTATLKITIHYGVPLGSGRYFLKVITPNGVDAEYFFSM